MRKAGQSLRTLAETGRRQLSRRKELRKVAVGFFSQNPKWTGIRQCCALGQAARRSLEDPRNVETAFERGTEKRFVLDCQGHVMEIL